jgi:hypothetical protein
VSLNLNSAAITLVSLATETPSKLLVCGHSRNDLKADKGAVNESEGSEAD